MTNSPAGLRALIQVVADQRLAPRGGGEEPLGGPQHPAAAIGVQEQRQQLRTVAQTVPAQRPIAERGDGESTVATEVDRPGSTGHRDRPDLLAPAIE